MKKLIIGLMVCLCVAGLCRASSISEDTIPVFLTEYVDGKPTGAVIQLELHIMKLREKTTWTLSQINIDSDKYGRVTTLQALKTTSEEDTDWPWLNDINWQPGKFLKCVFRPSGTYDINFNAVKNSNTRFGWDVKCEGKIKVHGTANTYERWEWRQIREVDLKYPKVIFVNLYNQ
jgi:hypothetical protein